MSFLEIAAEIGVLVLVYVLASVPIGLIITRMVAGIDVRTIGSGSGGATNVFRAIGLRWFVVVTLLDLAKGMLLMLGALFLVDNPYVLGLVPAIIIAGHCWPLWANFHGGKGSLVGISSLAVLYYELWWALLIITLCAGLTFFLTKTTSIVSLLGGLSVLIFVIVVSVTGNQPAEHLVGICLSMVLVLLRHKNNIRRLITGNELKMTR